MNGPQLQAPTFNQLVAIENYKSASKEALSAANSAGDKITAAAFSFATAYGAVIALVEPKETPAAVLAAIPFALLALAAVLALYAQSIGISIAGTDDVDKLKDAVDSAITAKRRWAWGALALLAAGVIVAGLIVGDKYAGPAQSSSPIQVEVWLSQPGLKVAEEVCGGSVKTMIEGTVASTDALSDERVGLTVNKASCGSGAGTLYLSQWLIAGARQAPATT
ncbi:MAG TPA: hypothetical protein VGG40_00520 [Solirubrobacterales bacterium]|jgi:hypothetical protein